MDDIEINLENRNKILEIVKEKLKNVKNVNQKKKYEKIFEICQDDIYI